MSAPCKELVTLLSEYAMVCRGCLAASGEMKNMFEWGLHKEFAKYKDVQIRRADGISELICSACEESLVICKNFRSQCQQSDLLLRKSLMQSQMQNFDYKYAFEEVHLLECKQFEMVSVEEIKKEHEEETEEDNVETNNINIKEEEEDWADTYQEVSLNTADVKSETPSDDDTPLKQLLEGASPRKRTLNVVHQRDTKRAKLNETTKDRNPLTNTALKIFPTKNRKTLYKSFSKKSSVDSNVKSSKNKLNIKSVANRHQGSRISPKVNTVPTHKIRVKNLVAQNSETSASNVVCDNAENETFKPCLPKSVDAVASNSRLHKDTVEKPYKCDLCDYRCPRRGNLESHTKYKHTKEKNFSCHMCQYKCVAKSQLSIHLRKHTGEKPYKCDICDYRFSRRDNLESHIKHKHTKEQNFSCHICQYKCVTKSKLSRHLREHTGEKPYKCDNVIVDGHVSPISINIYYQDMPSD